MPGRQRALARMSSMPSWRSRRTSSPARSGWTSTRVSQQARSTLRWSPRRRPDLAYDRAGGAGLNDRVGPGPMTRPVAKADDREPAVRLRGITKRFGDLLANDAVDLDVGRGEVHALLGENGAGKTTLMRILYGLTHADSGTIEVDGRVITIRSPRDAIAAGVGMVTQHFSLVRPMTVAENLALGRGR